MYPETTYASSICDLHKLFRSSTTIQRSNQPLTQPYHPQKQPVPKPRRKSCPESQNPPSRPLRMCQMQAVASSSEIKTCTWRFVQCYWLRNGGRAPIPETCRFGRLREWQSCPCPVTSHLTPLLLSGWSDQCRSRPRGKRKSEICHLHVIAQRTNGWLSGSGDN